MSILKSPLTYELPTESYPFRAMSLARNFAQEDPEKVAFVRLYTFEICEL